MDINVGTWYIVQTEMPYVLQKSGLWAWSLVKDRTRVPHSQVGPNCIMKISIYVLPVPPVLGKMRNMWVGFMKQMDKGLKGVKGMSFGSVSGNILP